MLSAWLPNLATDRLARRAPEVGADDRPLVTFRADHGTLRLVAVDPAAARLGLAPGMTLADARALAPGLAAEEADPAAEARLLDRLAARCRRYTPWTAPDVSHPAFPGGGIWLDVTGCAHLFGGEAALRRDLLARLASLGFAARAGVADTPGAAWAAARVAASEDDGIIPPGGAVAALAPLPVACLRLSASALATLARLGLRRVGDLYPLPRAALTARLGGEVCRRLDQALGRGEREPISPRLPEARYRAWLALPEPVAEAGVLHALARRLLDRLCSQLEAAGVGARRLWLDLHRADGSTGRAVAGTGRPTHAPDRLHRLLADRLAEVDPGQGIELMVLEAAVVEPLDPVQAALKRIADDAGEAADLVALIDRLNGRLGGEAVRRLYRRASHLPERSQGRRAAAAGAPPPPKADAPPPCQGWGDGPVRPLRLLARPEPIEATAPVPDEPPVLFRWRGRVVRVARASGPERVAPEWWRETPGADLDAVTRDYYGVEDADGRRFWLFREGLYDRGGGAPRWYLHGLFA
ncbi:MAG TPA: DNA polymerase Y family protein [Geminicoccaceae bacterium]|nr:DNA polymerase Y family protein [Geminicoccaceae bacterium]